MELNYKEILEYQSQVYPFLLIDHVDNVEPGVGAKGHKFLNMNDWFFKYHYVGDPIVPGVLLVEAIGQMATIAIVTLPGLKGKRCYLSKIHHTRCSGTVRPSSILVIDTNIISYKYGVAKVKGNCSVDDKVVCDAELTFIVVDQFNKVTP